MKRMIFIAALAAALLVPGAGLGSSKNCDPTGYYPDANVVARNEAKLIREATEAIKLRDWFGVSIAGTEMKGSSEGDLEILAGGDLPCSLALQAERRATIRALRHYRLAGIYLDRFGTKVKFVSQAAAYPLVVRAVRELRVGSDALLHWNVTRLPLSAGD